MQLKQRLNLKISNGLKQKKKNNEQIDIYSRYSECDLEFVRKEDEDNVLYLMDSYNEFNEERKYYD